MKTKHNSFFYFCILVSILMLTYPFAFAFVLPTPPIVLLMALTFFCFLLSDAKELVNNKCTLIGIVQLIGVIFLLLYSGDLLYIKQCLYNVWIICYFCFLKQYGVRRFLFYFNRMLLIVAILGTFSFFMALLFGANPILQYVNGNGGPGYIIYATFTNSVHGGDFIRYSAIFDEPGAMAYWGMFALLTNKLYVNDKILEIPLITCIVFTFSLAFYIQLVFYIFFFYIWGKTSVKTNIIVLSLIVFIVYLAINLDTSSPFYRFTFARFGLNNDDGFDNNREVFMDASIKLFKASPVFGVGPTMVDKMKAYDNPYETLGKDGIFGTVFVYLPLLCSIIYSRYDKRIFFASFILFLGYLQRPFHIQFTHYTMLYIFFYISYSVYNSKLQNKRQTEKLVI